jgi:hypothetical protein
MSRVRSNRLLLYRSWARGYYERWKLTIVYNKETHPFLLELLQVRARTWIPHLRCKTFILR